MTFNSLCYDSQIIFAKLEFSVLPTLTFLFTLWLGLSNPSWLNCFKSNWSFSNGYCCQHRHNRIFEYSWMSGSITMSSKVSNTEYFQPFSMKPFIQKVDFFPHWVESLLKSDSRIVLFSHFSLHFWQICAKNKKTQNFCIIF